jgi:DNA-binding NarL/FixJ family response regulator
MGCDAGAVGYLLKDVSSEKLYEAVRAAAPAAMYFLQPSITSKVIEEFSRLSQLGSAAGRTTAGPALGARTGNSQPGGHRRQ